MNVSNAKNIVAELTRRVPAFAEARDQNESYLSHGDTSPYLVFGDFARFLINTIKEEPRNLEAEAILRDSFDLLSEMATSPDDDLVNLAQVGVFEVLTDSPEAVLVARQYLAGEAADVFEHVVELWTPKHGLTVQ